MIALLGAALAACHPGTTTPGPGGPQGSGPQASGPHSNAAPDACSATLPTPVVYDGSPLPDTTDDDIWVILPPSTKGEILAALVHTTKNTVGSAVTVPKGKLPSFVGGLGPASQAVFIGHPNPPPPVIDGRWLVFIGKRTLAAGPLADADLKTCDP
jgi:hypothetical protein